MFPTVPLIHLSVLNIYDGYSQFTSFVRFQTDLLTLIMDHLVDADILIGEQAALPIVPGQNQ
jgi:hypothetical protein